MFFEVKIGFLVKNCVYRHLGMSRIQDFEEKQAKPKGGKIFFRVRSPEVFISLPNSTGYSVRLYDALRDYNLNLI